MSRRSGPPDHRGPEATAGLRERRRKRGLPVGDKPIILDAEGRTVLVGSKIDGGDAIGEVTAIRSVEDREGGCPMVLVRWPDLEFVEEWPTRVRDYRSEGPSGPYVYVCDEAEVVDV